MATVEASMKTKAGGEVNAWIINNKAKYCGLERPFRLDMETAKACYREVKADYLEVKPETS